MKRILCLMWAIRQVGHAFDLRIVAVWHACAALGPQNGSYWRLSSAHQLFFHILSYYLTSKRTLHATTKAIELAFPVLHDNLFVMQTMHLRTCSNLRNIVVSVVIPVRNEERFISECLDSLLKQTYPKDQMEWIIVDGKSDDSTWEVLESYRSLNPELIICLLYTSDAADEL